MAKLKGYRTSNLGLPSASALVACASIKSRIFATRRRIHVDQCFNYVIIMIQRVKRDEDASTGDQGVQSLQTRLCARA